MRNAAIALLGITTLFATEAIAQERSTQDANASSESAKRTPTASTLRNKAVYEDDGKEFGRISQLLRNDNGVVFAVVTTADNRRLLIRVNDLTVERNRYYVEADQRQNAREYNADDRNYSEVEPNERLAISRGSDSQRTAENRDRSRIIVRQPAPTVRFNQESPQIDVRQPQPRVTVRQRQPEILVRQPSPTITVDIPQPEITLRMPRPEVSVAQAQPQVDVTQPKPRVEVKRQQQQADVQIERDQPQVNVRQRADAEARVQVQDANVQPKVQYERAKPRVVVNEPKGEPQVRLENMSTDEQQARPDAQQETAANTGQRWKYRTEAERHAYQERLGDDSDDTAGTNTGLATRPLPVRDLVDKDVYNARGEMIGEVDRVIMTPADGKQFIVLAHGGFLGIGEDKVAFPMKRFSMRGDELVIRGVTESDLDAMDNWQNDVPNYRNLRDADQVNVSVAQ